MQKKPRIMFYHDGRHPLIYMYEPPMQKEEYEQGVDELIGTPIDTILFCLGDGRTVLHETKAGELWGTPNEKWGHLIFRRAYQNAKHLIEEGNDPLRVICDRAHEKGFNFYTTLLVNQGSGQRGVDTRGSDFRFNRKHMDIGAKGNLPADYPGAGNADFMYQEIRDERLALIEETLNKYPVDGFDLNLNYVPYYFHPSEVKKGRKVMTEWVRDVSSMVKKSGAGRELIVCIPGNEKQCLSVGLDPRTWIEQGLVQGVIGQNFSGSLAQGPAADFTELICMAKGSGCRIYASLMPNVDSDRVAEANIQIIRAMATNYWDQGVDGLFLYQWFSAWPYQADFYEKLREVPYPEVMAPKDKYYYVPTHVGRMPEGKPVDPGIPVQLPVDLETNKPVSVTFSITDDLRKWDKASRVFEVLLRARVVNTTELDKFDFKLNGKLLPAKLLRKINRLYQMGSPRYRINNSYWYIFKLDKAHWPVKGRNTFEVTLLERDPDITPQIFLRDVELETKYLMGKNYHRGFVDRDLGPYEKGS